MGALRIGLALALGIAAFVAMAEGPAVDPETLSPEQRALYERGTQVAREAEQASTDGRVSRLVKRAGEAVLHADKIATIDTEKVLSRVESYADRAKAATSRYADMPDPQSLQELFRGMPWADEAKQIAEAAMEAMPEERKARYIVLATRAMGPARLREVLRLSRSRDDYVVAFRGPLPEQTVMDMIRELVAIMELGKKETPPNVILDPVRFQGEKPVAPVLLRLDEEGEVLASVEGVINPEWIEARIARGERGALGRYGEVSEVAEIDMLRALQERFAEYDMEGKLREAHLHYFDRVRLPHIEEATEDRERYWDPSVVLEDGITLPDGRVVVYPGTRLNPLHAVGFGMTLVFFDGTDPAQVAWAREQVAQRDGQKVYAIATAFDGSAGWEGFGRLMSAINARVFHTNPLLVQRFGIERVPCLVMDGTRDALLIREFGVDGIRKRYGRQDDTVAEKGMEHGAGPGHPGG